MKKDNELLEEVVEKNTEDGEKVLIDKLTLSNILERLAAVESGTNDPIKKVKRLGNRTAKVRYVDGKIIKSYGKSWDKMELGGKKYMVIEVYDIDGVKHEVEYLKLIEGSDYVDAEILSIDKQEYEEELGSTLLAKVDYDNYKTEITDKEVPMVVRSCKFVYKMKLPSGEVIELPEEALN